MMLAGLVLAAGGSSRFGSPKALAHYRGQSLVRRAVGLLMQRCSGGVSVVVGSGAEALGAELAGVNVTLIPNPRWSLGLSTSLQEGVGGLPTLTDAVLILLCDQPAITGQDLETLIGAWQLAPDMIAAAGFDGRLGSPAIMPRAAWPQLAGLRGDQGARSLLEWHTEYTRVPMPHAAMDVDTPADLARLEALREA